MFGVLVFSHFSYSGAVVQHFFTPLSYYFSLKCTLIAMIDQGICYMTRLKKKKRKKKKDGKKNPTTNTRLVDKADFGQSMTLGLGVDSVVSLGGLENGFTNESTETLRRLLYWCLMLMASMNLLKRGVLILKIGLAVLSKHQSIFTSFERARGSLLKLLDTHQSFLLLPFQNSISR